MQQTLIIASYFSQINNIMGSAGNSAASGMQPPTQKLTLQQNPLFNNPLASMIGGGMGPSMMGGMPDFSSLMGMASGLGGTTNN
jgi:hypothetical protein